MQNQILIVKVGTRWPPRADVRLKRLMHDENIYDYDEDKPEFKILNVIKALKVGTEIEQCSSDDLVNRFDKFKIRVVDRIRVLKGVLLGNRLIEVGADRELGKTEIFLKYWKAKESFWGPKASSKEAFTHAKVSKESDIYDMDSEPSDHETVAVKDPKSTSKVTQKVECSLLNSTRMKHAYLSSNLT
jgi:hypothetical protein